MKSRSSNGRRSPDILFVGKRFYTNKDALAEKFGRIFHLPREWASAGKDVRVWLLDYHSRAAARSIDEGFPIDSTPVASFGFIRRLVAVLARNRPRVVVASGDCYIGLLGWMLAKLSRATFVFDVYDKYDEFGAYVRPLGWDLFGFLLRRADLTFFASRALAERLSKAVPGGEHAVVPNGVDGARFLPHDRLQCRRALGLPADAILAGYFGGMEPDRGVMDLIQAIDLLRQQGQDIQLLICGRQHPETPLDKDWILYRGMVAHDQMPIYIGATNVLVIPYRLSEFMDMGASCKIAEFLMCARPLVSTTTPNLMANFPVQALEMGAALSRPGDAGDLARALDHALGHGQLTSVPTGRTWPEIGRIGLQSIDRLAREKTA